MSCIAERSVMRRNHFLQMLYLLLLIPFTSLRNVFSDMPSILNHLVTLVIYDALSSKSSTSYIISFELHLLIYFLCFTMKASCSYSFFNTSFILLWKFCCDGTFKCKIMLSSVNSRSFNVASRFF